MARIVILLIQVYRFAISPFLPPACRFYPSCSAYALQAYRSRGLLRGSWLTGIRVIKCHPFHPGGYDPLPVIRKRTIHTHPAA